ncbi:hypothetical protein BDR03DRAFT_806127, partial [Suillus americanus]
GGMVLEMMTKEAAEHIRTDINTKTLFLQSLDAEASIKQRTYPVVIPFMPVTFHPENQSNIRQLEEENGWEKMVIMYARWIKPAEKRRSNQQVAHILITFTDPSTANSAIRN